MTQPNTLEDQKKSEDEVGHKVRDVRIQQKLSLRLLAELSGLNINTLSLIENGKSSPSVSTLQQVARALDVPITSFFESTPVEKACVFTRSEERPKAQLGNALMENLGKDLRGNSVQPFVVTLPTGFKSGENMIVHTGHEFIYCLKGTVRYVVDQEDFVMREGDSLIFEAHLPHRWQNEGSETSQLLLILYPMSAKEKSGEHHFTSQILIKEKYMKIAVITEDGNSISQHFGRAPYYKVFTIENNQICGSEIREKKGHNQFGENEHDHHHGEHHGMDAATHGKHSQMASAIADCQTLICGGMGTGAYESMRRLNIQPIVTDVVNIDEAVKIYLDGKLVDHIEKLH